MASLVEKKDVRNYHTVLLTHN